MTDDFWEWLPKAYRDGDVGDEPRFTKYCMEVAYAAGAEAEAKRMWQGLTDEERNNLWRDVTGWGDPSHDDEDLMKAIEAKLREKNT